MTDLRKLLEDARSALYALGEKHYDKIAERIDAALAEPVEPLTFDHFTNSDHREDFGPVTEGRYVLKTDYGTLQSALKLAQEERDKRMTRMMAAEKRAEKAEAERDKCKRIAWDWGQGVTDAETAIRQLHKLFPIDAELLKEIEK